MKAKVKTWLRNIENGKIKNYTEQILSEIKNNTKKGFYGLFEKDGISTYELRNTTGISHQTLTSALSNLYDEGLIQSTNQIQIEDKHYSVYVFNYDNEIRLQTIDIRKKEKFLQWLKKADYFNELLNDATLEMIDMEIFVLNKK